MTKARWGMPTPQLFQECKRTDPGVTNLRDVASQRWRRWLIAERVEDVSHLLTTLGRPVMIDANDGRADEVKRPVLTVPRSSARHPREQAKELFPSRDFH